MSEAITELKQDEFKELYKEETEDAARAFLKTGFVSDCQIDTDMELLFPDDYIQSVSERMLLYRELDNQESEDALQLFENSLIDRFGKLPQPSRELIDVVRLRWLAIGLGMEKIILKNGWMICHFIADQRSPFYQSPVFGKVLQYVQTNPKNCRMKESENKLTLTFPKVESISQAKQILQKVNL